jgi:hypothetical protein
VIEEEYLQLHFEGVCFELLLLFGAWIGCRTRVQKGLEGTVRVGKGGQGTQLIIFLFILQMGFG